ncbi:MAG: C39 family peptidase [Polaromonas sp.]|uniref:C39 family peptidase n=1 Tax=Polaromonas sp. TaxID=1869339 RepID=UPI002717BFC1|nr:C39 family peptidase [Polaromonas sp.]MDO9114790.1 C39 family peptidase [Polaromonas sp.]MDP1885958.1 C39 family peptidase [Polaromonas sp.]
MTLETRRRIPPAAWLLGHALACLPVAGHAGVIGLGGVIPGAGAISKNVLSMREMRYVDMVPQKTDFSCGAAALATILNYAYGQKLTEDEVIQGLLQVSDPAVVREKGFSLLDLKNYVQARGMRGRGYNMAPEMLDRIKVPTIVLLDIRGYKHFVVLKKTTPDKVYLADPALGNRVVPRQEFVSGWNRVVFAVIGQGFERDTVLLRPSEPLTARSTMDTWRPLTDAQLLEFGFSSAELF